MDGNGSRFVSTKWLIGILMFIVFAASGLIVGDTRNSVTEVRSKTEALQEKKLDKEQYYIDMREIKETLKDIARDVKNIKK